MGSAASKSETKVFTPKAPVDYSSSFLSHLETSQDSDYTRAQYTENYIQERVAAELKKLEADTIEKFKSTASEATSKETSNKESVEASNEKIVSLSKLLQDNANLVQLELPSEIKDARQSVIACLKENKGKTLNCWEEVQQFKKLVHSM